MCAAIFGGPAFVRSFELATCGRRVFNASCVVTPEMREDAQYWLSALLTLHNGRSFSHILADPQRTDFITCADASALIGMGGSSTSGRFFQCLWSDI